MTYVVTKSDGSHNPHRFNLALLSTVLSIGLRAILHAPTDTVVWRKWYGLAFSRFNAFILPRLLCRRCQKYFRIGRLIQPSNDHIGLNRTHDGF